MKKNWLSFGCACGAVAVAIAAGPALAQTATTPISPAAPPAADADVASARTEGLQEIVVTATRSELNLQFPRNRL